MASDDLSVPDGGLPSGHAMVVGAGGSGKSAVLDTWVRLAGRPVGRIVGRPSRPTTADDVERVLEDRPDILVCDDLHWMSDGALEAIVAASGRHLVWASRRAMPLTAAGRVLDELLCESAPPMRLSTLEDDRIARLLAQHLGRPPANDLVEELRDCTGGWPALVADVLALGDVLLMGEDELGSSVALREQVVARVDRSGPGASLVLRMRSFEPAVDLAVALAALPDDVDPELTERQLRASGLVVDGGDTPVPLVARCLAADLTVRERTGLRSHLLPALIALHPAVAARHLDPPTSLEANRAADLAVVLIGRREPEAAAEAARLCEQVDHTALDAERLTAMTAVALRLGHPRLPLFLERAAASGVAVHELAMARDLRDLRWPLVAGARGESLSKRASQMASLGNLLVARRTDDGNGEAVDGAIVDGGSLDRLLAAVSLAATGDAVGASVRLAALCDETEALDEPAAPLGLSVRQLAALVGLGRGDHQGAEAALKNQVGAGEGGPASCEAARALLSVVRLRRGDLQSAVDIEGEPLPVALPAVRLFRAAATAGLARRSGDTARLRFAWGEADEVLVRPVASWLLTEVLSELVLAGARLGDGRRSIEVVEELRRQADSLGTGWVAATVAWLDLQVAVQRNDHDALRAAAARLDALAPTDPLGRARSSVGRLWATGVASSSVSDDAWIEAAEALASVGDPWEASRFLGQAALDHPNATGARRFLEVARALSVEVADVEGGSGLVAHGLSEREAEVAQLIVEGLTYKEIGSRLYISPKTVEHHVARSRQKLGATSRAEFLAAVENLR